MKPGGLFTALGVLIVLGGLVWWSNKHPSVPATTTPPAPKLISVDQKQIDGIRIVKPGAEPIELAKLAGTWEIAKPMPLLGRSGRCRYVDRKPRHPECRSPDRRPPRRI